jgi:hypothetical protein
MDRGGALPERCIVCNANAGHRLTRTLYSSPLAWRICATAIPFTALGIGVAAQTPLLVGLFWPLVLLLMVAHTFVRKKIELELGMCRRHRQIRLMLGVLSAACLAGIIAITIIGPGLGFLPVMGVLVLTLLVLAIAWSYTGAQAVMISKLTDEHLWLARTGKPFLVALPELPAER